LSGGMPDRYLAWVFAMLLILGSAQPVVADDIRDFNADTPGKSYTPYTVAQGYFQVESDSFHIVQMGGTQLIETLDPVFKYGLTGDVELELQTGGLLNMQTTAGGRTVSLTGLGDLTPQVKWNVFGNDWQVFSAALKFGVKIPTASPGLGNGAVEYNLIATTQSALPAEFSLQVQEEVDILKNQDDTGKHFSYAEDVSVSRSFGHVTISAELFAQSGTDPNEKALYTADLGVGYAVTPTVVISFGTYFGLNRDAPSVEAYTGFGFRF
jgi:hypothetical protein